LPLETLPFESRATAVQQVIGDLSDLGESTFQTDRRTAPAIGAEATRTYTITLKNIDIQAHQVLITNTIPAELAIDPATLTGGASYNPTTQQLTWQGLLPANAEQIVSYEAAPSQPFPTGTRIDNTLDIYYPDQDLTFDRSVSYWINAPDLTSSALTVSPENGHAGDTIYYQLVLLNNGLTAAETTSATLHLPDSLGLLTDTLQLTGGSAEIDGRSLTWQGQIGVHQAVTVSVMMTTPLRTYPLWLPVTAIISDGATAVIVKDSLLYLIPYQAYFPAIAKPQPD
ncbi:MAG: hypothetical protein WAM60_09900, partial [Candidatus Promineifilaceae bacterium]